MKRLQIESEDDMIIGLREGNEQVFGNIFRRYWFPLYDRAYAKLQTHELAEEVVQDLFVDLWEKRNALLITNLTHYLQASLKNRCIDVIRKKVTKEKYFEYCKRYFPTTYAGQEETAELTKEIERGVAILPEKTRAIFVQNRVEGLPNREIAKFHKVTEKAVEYHISKSIKQLRLYLKDYLLISFAFIDTVF